MAINVYMVDSTEVMAIMADRLALSQTSIARIFITLEGVNLSRVGSISLVICMIEHLDDVFFIDINTLGGAAFNIPGAQGITLKNILESPSITKVFFDLTNDSDALHSHFNVSLQGVEDLQLMEFAIRPVDIPKIYVKGLDSCIRYYLDMGPIHGRNWMESRLLGQALLNDQWKAESLEISDHILNYRPIRPEMVTYFAFNVIYLPNLRNAIFPKLTATMKAMVEEETKARVLKSHQPDYNHHDINLVLGPLSLRMREQDAPQHAV